MTLAAGAPTQFSSGTNGDSFTTGSLSPVSGKFYVGFVFGRYDADGVSARTPTLAGTNGWNVTWTRVAAAHADELSGANVRAHIDAFWGIASSGTAGTLTFDFGAGADYGEGALHLVPITGSIKASPIGATGSGNTAGIGATSVSATLTGSPETTSTVAALGSTDTASATFTAGTNYSLLGAKQAPDVAATQPEKWDGPTNTTVAISCTATDLMAISAVEIQEQPWQPETDADELIRTVSTPLRW